MIVKQKEAQEIATWKRSQEDWQTGRNYNKTISSFPCH
jgi:hypothetical protein